MTSNLDYDVTVASYAVALRSSKLEPLESGAVETNISSNQNNSTEPLIFWKYLDSDCEANELSLSASLIHYITIKTRDKSQGTPSDWSRPMRVKVSEATSGSRQNVTLPLGEGCDLVEVSAVRKDGVMFLSLTRDENPNVVIHNNTQFDLLFGQTFLEKSVTG